MSTARLLKGCDWFLGFNHHRSSLEDNSNTLTSSMCQDNFLLSLVAPAGRKQVVVVVVDSNPLVVVVVGPVGSNPVVVVEDLVGSNLVAVGVDPVGSLADNILDSL